MNRKFPSTKVLGFRHPVSERGVSVVQKVPCDISKTIAIKFENYLQDYFPIEANRLSRQIVHQSSLKITEKYIRP